MITRRRLILGAAGAAGSTLALPLAALDGAAPGGAGATSLHALPGKRPLIKRTYRPPNYETPVADLAPLYTPNDAFFVRYHLGEIPTLSAAAWRLTVGGEALRAPYALDFAALARLPQTEIVAVVQCQGMARGLAETRSSGVPWGRGAVGNARWRGVRLRDILERAGLAADALEVVLHGADGPPRPTLPDFVVSLPLAKALHPDTLLAYAMNDEPLPHWHGHPVRLVAPGWSGRYWMKHLTAVEVVRRPLESYWMNTAYRVPVAAFTDNAPFDSQTARGEKAITEIALNAIVTNLVDGQRLIAGRPYMLQGHAWDRGRSALEGVRVSLDGGRRWEEARLDAAPGPYSFQPWRYPFVPHTPGPLTVMVQATARDGRSQPLPGADLPAGYFHHAVAPLRVIVESV